MTVGDLVTAPFQVQWRGELWGWPATAITISNLSGWLDRPAMRTGNTDRPGRHGAVPGQQRATSRLIEVEFTAAADDPQWLRRLADAVAPDEDPLEEPLVIWAGADEPQLVFARVERAAVPTGHAWSVGLERAMVQWVCTDPRRYGVQEQTAAIGLPTVAGLGLPFPLVFPLDWGAGLGGGQMSLVHAGNVATWPVWEITGPVTGPIISNLDSGEQLVFDPGWTIPAGQTAVIDTDWRTVKIGDLSYDTKLFGRGWFPLPKASTTAVGFASVGGYDPAALLTGRWRHAYM